MSLSTTTPTVTAPAHATTRSARSLRRTTVIAGLVAAAVTAGVAAALHAADVALHVLAAAIVVPALVRHAHD
jgi:hypothetical protein